MRLKRNSEYLSLLAEIKSKVKSAQIKAAISVNRELLKLYWEIGSAIVEKQKKGRWGDSVVDALAEDLRKEFPEMRGFSRANLFNIRQWYMFYSDMGEKVQQLVGQLPWGHNIVIINKVKGAHEALFYVKEAIENNLSRNMLVHQIESGLSRRKGRITSNFDLTLPKPQSDLARQSLKDPYVFDFLSITEKMQEGELEKQLTRHITQFLLELGAGFSLVGHQYSLEIGKEDYFIDLLFYHLKLRCYVAIELKMGDFRPEYVGKLNFYLSALDKLIREPNDNPSIGIILCKSKNKVVVEYALSNMNKPIGVSEYKIMKSIPEKLKKNLPSIGELEDELKKVKG